MEDHKRNLSIGTGNVYKATTYKNVVYFIEYYLNFYDQTLSSLMHSNKISMIIFLLKQKKIITILRNNKELEQMYLTKVFGKNLEYKEHFKKAFQREIIKLFKCSFIQFIKFKTYKKFYGSLKSTLVGNTL